jgi:hypothetical protein
MSVLKGRSYVLLILVLLLVSCTKTGNSRAETVIKNLQRTNLDSSQFPWLAGVADGKTKRWDIGQDGLIPVKINGSAVARQALDEIESVLQMSVFDRDSIANVPDDLIERGIIISEGTALGPNGTVTRFTCGHVSAGPDTADYPKDFYDETGRINTRLYVNLSSSKCTASVEIAIHELGHALGLGNHFRGFGSGTVISQSFWDVLNTLYNNEVGVSATELEIRLPGP